MPLEHFRIALADIRTSFVPAPEHSVNISGKFSHKVIRGHLNGSQQAWIKKEMKNPKAARNEYMAQEFFRLIIPHQPETRLLKNPITNVHYILSEEVPNYRKLPREPDNFANGIYTGLGQVIAASVFLQEIDLKNGNLGLDDGNRVIKIDGDWCFAQTRNNHSYGLTPKMIDNLPYPHDFYAFNWLDIILEEEKKCNSKIVDPSLTKAKQFRAEVNQAMLKICLLPDSFIDHFVDTYMSGAPNYYSKLIQNRRMELLDSALQNLSFKTYLETPQAKEDALSLSRQMETFIANGDLQVLPTYERQTMADKVMSNLKILQEGNINEIKSLGQEELKQTTLYEENINILEKIWSYRVNKKDKIMGQYIYSVKKTLKNMSEIELIETKLELNKILQSVGSAETLAVKEAIQSYRKNIHWWTVGKEKKAQRIENALLNTPLLERKNVITANGPANKVQEALASHRYWGSSGKVYKNKHHEIDYNKAGASFKKFKKRLSKETKEIIDQEESMNSEMKHP